MDEANNSRRNVSKGDGHECPRIYQMYKDIFDCGPVRHGEGGEGDYPL
jgi:hypothetical protein